MRCKLEQSPQPFHMANFLAHRRVILTSASFFSSIPIDTTKPKISAACSRQGPLESRVIRRTQMCNQSMVLVDFMTSYPDAVT